MTMKGAVFAALLILVSAVPTQAKVMGVQD